MHLLWSLSGRIACSLFCVLPAVVDAQQAQVQQPVVEVFSVDTAVSVPDRGSAFWGGFSSAREASATLGPLPYGSSFGRAASNSSTSTHVHIHDFKWLDQQLLLEAEQSLGLPQRQASSTVRQQVASDVLREYSVPREYNGTKPVVGSSRINAPLTRREKALQILRERSASR